jgi:pyruvate dehydrogenase E1 component
MRAHADQIRPFIAQRYKVLGTDGFGRSDTRRRLREFFEVDRHWVVLAALKALADDGEVPASTVTAALARYGLDPKKPNPVTV